MVNPKIQMAYPNQKPDDPVKYCFPKNQSMEIKPVRSTTTPEYHNTIFSVLFTVIQQFYYSLC
jgi:hypothetical protein